jgi:hypothetical protein
MILVKKLEIIIWLKIKRIIYYDKVIFSILTYFLNLKIYLLVLDELIEGSDKSTREDLVLDLD